MTQTFSFTRRALMVGGLQAGAAAFALTQPSRAAGGLPKMTVTRDPTCGCCGGWVAHMKEAGFSVEVVESSDLAPLKARLGVPQGLVACHTAQIDGFAIEGHVPAGSVKRLLAERPQAAGLAVAGMPMGSPGMEAPGSEPDIYEVVLFGPGFQRTFARYRGLQET